MTVAIQRLGGGPWPTAWRQQLEYSVPTLPHGPTAIGKSLVLS
ncbi:MAG: hypothetical protein PHE53_11140 [Thermoguttaceae bacterium]|nr:hypothetical protein [Thermoguttaceae bacterium]